MTEPEIDTSYTPEMMDSTQKYLIDLKRNNRKLYNKYKKNGRKFSDTIMKRLK